MDLKKLLRLLRRRWWIPLLGAVLVGAATFGIRAQQSNEYNATVMMSVGGYLEASDPSSGEIRTGADLAVTYVTLAKTTEVLQAAIDSTNIRVSPEKLRDKLDATFITNTSMFELTVTYPDPEKAAAIANAIAQELIARSPTNLSAAQRFRFDVIQAEIDWLSAQITASREQLDLVDQKLALSATLDPAERQELADQHRWLTEQTNNMASNLARFIDMAAAMENPSNSLKIIEAATAPEKSQNSSFIVISILGAVLGAVGGTGIVLGLDLLDDTLSLPDEVEQKLSLPVLATVPKLKKSRRSGVLWLDSRVDPTGLAADKFRQLRTSLLTAPSSDRIRTYVFTGAEGGEGKSVTAANLAVAMAAGGLQVLLVDADLRRPRLHRLFGVENNAGLSTLLTTTPSAALADPTRLELTEDFQNCIRETPVHGLRLIASGPYDSKASDLLGSQAMREWFEAFKAAENVDIIVFDTPPTLAVADSAMLTAVVGAQVILVVRFRKTRAALALEAEKLFGKQNLPIYGVVLTLFDPKELGRGFARSYAYLPKNGAKGA
jgi:succinoglycan biosynthesis transport protein ExoP